MEEFNRRRFVRVQRLGQRQGSAPGATTLLVEEPETVWIRGLKIEDGVAIMQFTGRPRHPYILQAKDSLGSAEWRNVVTNAARADGTGELADADAKAHPARFYRIASE